LLNLEPYSRRDARAAQLDDFFPGILDQGRVRGGLYGLPADGGGPALFYNEELFERAGVPAPGTQQDAGKWTVETFLDAGKRLTRRGSPDAEQWGAHDPLYHNSVWLAWVWAWGGDFLNKDGSQVVLDQAAAVDALQWQQDLITRHGMVPATSELDQLKDREPIDRRAMFRAGRVAMISDWTTAVGSGRLREAEGQGLRWDATLLPVGKSGQYSVAFFHELVVAAPSKAPELAWQWVAHQSGPEGTLRRSLSGATQPHRRSAATNPEFIRTLPPAFAKSMAKIGERSRPYPLVVEDQQLQTILGEELKLLGQALERMRQAR
jgi:multiple sugar transport system substrate-binding protein